MSRAAIFAFKRKVRELRQKYEYDLEQVEADIARKRNTPITEMHGSGRQYMLEAQSRVLIIDPLLKELGWDVGDSTSLALEDPVEPVADEPNVSRRFLDYHGRENSSGSSFLIIEAKRANAELPQSGIADTPTTLTRAITSITTQTPGGNTLGGIWQERLESLIDYAKRAKQEFGHTAVRVVITNGEWYVIFEDVEATLLSTSPDSSKIRVFADLENVEEQCELFYNLLHYNNLAQYIPPQYPAALAEFIQPTNEVSCAIVLDIEYTPYGQMQPALAFSVAAWVETENGVWVLFRKSYPEEECILLHHHVDMLSNQCSQIEERVKDLIADLSTSHDIALLTPEEFEGRISFSGPGEEGEPAQDSNRNYPLLSRLDGTRETYRLAIGSSELFFNIEHDYIDCPFHSWGECSKTGDANGSNGIVASSTEPRAFFPSGSPCHCAHRAIHSLRDSFCVIMPLEEFLCCRACCFFERCWPNDNTSLPCTTS